MFIFKVSGLLNTRTTA